MAGYVTDAPDTLKLKVFCIEEYRTKPDSPLRRP